MECVLRGLNWQICLIYIDDIIIFSKTFEEHLQHLHLVFSRLRQANIKLKLSKCHFAYPKVTYLGHIVSRLGTQPDPDKISAVQNFPVPKKLKDLRSFLGLANYYRRFVKDFSKIAHPLTKLLRKNEKFIWSPACHSAFTLLKHALVSAPILRFPDFSKPFELYVDASLEGLGMTLGQIQNNREVVIAYAGRNLSHTEQAYSTTEREALAVIGGINKFEPYLYGQRFTVHTDHHALRWLMNIKDVTGRLARWSLFIQQFDFEIKHRPGVNNGNADALSRRPYPSEHANLYSLTIDQNEHVREMQRKDTEFLYIIQYLESKTLPEDENICRKILAEIDHYLIDDNGVLQHLWIPTGRKRADITVQLVVPSALRFEVLKSMHDDHLGGHLGIEKTYTKIHTRYFWPGLFKDVQHWCRSCAPCAMRKTPQNRHKAPLLPIPVEGAFDRIAVDCLGPYPESYSGNPYVIVFSDYLTKWPEAFAVRTTDAPVIAKLLVEEILCRHGSPRTLLSDRGKNFLSTLVREVCKLMSTTKLNTTAYHPQCDGLVERFNAFISQTLTMYVSANQRNWDEFLPSILFAYRSSPSASTGDSPFYLLYGRESRFPVDIKLLPPNVDKLATSIATHRERIVTQLEEAQRLAKLNIERTQ